MLTKSISQPSMPAAAVVAFMLLAIGAGICLTINPIAGLVAGFALLFLPSLAITSRFDRILFVIVYTELALGGRGHIVDFWHSVSLRQAIIGFLLVAFLFAWIGDGLKTQFLQKCPGCLRVALMGFVLIFFFGLILGRLNRNSMDLVIGDLHGCLVLFTAIPMFYFATRAKDDSKFVLGSFLGAVSVYGALKTIGYSLIVLGFTDVATLGNKISADSSQSVIRGGAAGTVNIPRIYTVGDILLAFALPLLVSIMIEGARARRGLVMFLAVGCEAIGLIASGTRGLWVGALLGLGMAFGLSKVSGKLKIAFAGLALIVAFLGLFPRMSNIVLARLDMSFNMTEPSNLSRLEQYGPLMAMARKHIWIGNGFGSFAPDLIKNPKYPYSYELQPMEFLMKFGILGCGLWILFFVWLFLDLWRLYRRAQNPFHRSVARGLLGGCLAIAFASGTNPYILSLPALSCIVLTAIIADILRYQVGESPRRESASARQRRSVGVPRAFGPSAAAKSLVP